MSKFDKKFTKDPWSKLDTSMASGNRVILNPDNKSICEVLPVRYPDSMEPDVVKQELIIEEYANEQLIRMSPLMFEELESALEDLENIKSGKLTVFQWDIQARINSITNLLRRATDLS